MKIKCNIIIYYFSKAYSYLFLFCNVEISNTCWDKPVIIDCSIPSTYYSLPYVSLSGQCHTWQNFPVVGKKKNELYITYHLIFVRKKVPCSLKTSRIWKLPGKASIMESLWLWFHDILYFTLLCLLCFILLYFYVLSWRWFKHSLSN